MLFRSASIGVQTDGGAMFIAGMTSIAEPPFNDLWTIPGEEKLLEEWKTQDSNFFNSINAMEYYMKLQNEDFADAIIHNRKPMTSGEEGRVTVELFTAIYRSQRDNKPVKFPLKPEIDRSILMVGCSGTSGWVLATGGWLFNWLMATCSWRLAIRLP